jgi:hypothetical protein
MRRALLLVVPACGLLAACGLPLPDGVQRPGPAVERAAQPGDVNVLPPDPRPDADAVAVVEGFVDAQSSPKGDHAIARKFLAPGVAWDDREAQVYDERGVPTEIEPGLVQVRYKLRGQVRADGTWLAQPRFHVATYRLQRTGQTWRLTAVPEGLHLSVRDRDRSFRRRAVHFVASTGSRLVAEPVLQPVLADPAQGLVDRLLSGPGADLQGAVRSAAPEGTRLLAPVTTEGGTVTVDLSEQVEDLGAGERRLLSAQLVWTLREVPSFSRLRLLAGGRPLVVEGREEQRRDDYEEQAPDVVADDVPLYFVRDRALRTLPATAAGPVPGERPPVDGVAVSPIGDLVAVLTRLGARSTAVSTGPVEGPYERQVVRAEVTSPTFGSGEQGLWFLEQGQVRLLPRGSTRVQEVAVEGGGGLTSLALSRDGARAAVVRRGELLVGRVEPVGTGLRLAGLRPVAPALTQVHDVAWSAATELVVLARAAGQSRVPVRVSVDGAVVTPITRGGVNGAPDAVAAAGDRLVVLPARAAVLYQDSAQGFEPVAEGTAPAFPG